MKRFIHIHRSMNRTCVTTKRWVDVVHSSFCILRVHARADNISLLSSGKRLVDGIICLGYILIRKNMARYRSTYIRARMNSRSLHVAKKRERKRARNRRCAHGQKIGRAGFLTQTRAFPHTKTVLLIDDNIAELGKHNFIGQQRRRTKKHAQLPVPKRLKNVRSVLGIGCGCEHIKANTSAFEERAELLSVLLRQNTRGRKHARLRIAILTKRKTKSCNNRFSAANITHEQAIHSVWTTHIQKKLVSYLLLFRAQLKT